MEDAGDALTRLAAIMARLRDPVAGCPWDLEQDFASIAPYTIEEAHEVADAIARGDMADLMAELGDLQLQIVFHARIAEEAGHFTLSGVVAGIADKMVRRHPHVFADADRTDRAQATSSWETIKANERAARAETGALDGVALGLPALMRAEKLQKRAARVGFDWPDADGPRAPRSTRSWTRSPPQPMRTNARWSSATCCSRSSTGDGIWGSIPRRHCAAPTPSSNVVSR